MHCEEMAELEQAIKATENHLEDNVEDITAYQNEEDDEDDDGNGVASACTKKGL